MPRFLVIVSLIVISGCVWEEPERFYVSREELAGAGEIKRGWVPPWLPASAHEIHLVSNLDTNEVWMRFMVDPVEVDTLRSCSKSSKTTLQDTRGPHIRQVAWWPGPSEAEWTGYVCSWDQGGRSRVSSLVVAEDAGIVAYWEE